MKLLRRCPIRLWLNFAITRLIKSSGTSRLVQSSGRSILSRIFQLIDARVLGLLLQRDTIHKKREMQNFCFNLAEQALLNRGLSVDDNRDKLARAVAHALQ